VDRESEQVGVGDLLVAEQALSNMSKGFGDSNIFAPEAMRRMLKAAIQHLQRVSRRNSVPRKDWIRHNPNKAGLGHSAGRPTMAGILREPALRSSMSLVRRP
jgi:hypothetical protein